MEFKLAGPQHIKKFQIEDSFLKSEAHHIDEAFGGTILSGTGSNQCLDYYKYSASCSFLRYINMGNIKVDLIQEA